MNFVEAVKTCFSKYFDFKGRARRSEYWWFYLFTIIGSIVASILDMALFSSIGGGVEIIGTIFSLAVFIPTIAAACRRLHDTNRSGWWQLLPAAGILALIPGITMAVMSGGEPSGAAIALMALGGLALVALAILLIVWLATDGTEGDNRFGPSFKYGSIDQTFS